MYLIKYKNKNKLESATINGAINCAIYPIIIIVIMYLMFNV